MRFFQALSRKAPNKVFFSITLGGVAGIGYSALIPLVLNSIRPQDNDFPELDKGVEKILSLEIAHFELAMLFFISCILVFLARSISEILLIRVANDVSRDFRLKFYHRISHAPIAALEKVGTAKLIASINIDVPRIVMGARAIPGLLIYTVSLVSMLGFLLYLNADIFWLVMGAIVFGIIAYQIPMLFGRRIFYKSRYVYDHLQGSVRGLISGAKELKLNNVKRNAYFKDVLSPYENDILKYDNRGFTIIRATQSFGELISFFIIGLVSFVFVNYHVIAQDELIGVIMALLYVVAPISNILNSIPQLTVAFVSFRKVNQLFDEIPEEKINPLVVPVAAWEKVSFSQVEYCYETNNDDISFKVGPLDFEIEKGKITFIVGANGSGKSTLSKLITLHYLPVAGSIRFGMHRVTLASVASYRQEICAIYSDYYLFDRLLGEVTKELIVTARIYLEQLHLSEKVKIENGRFSTISLSDGQKKRLALLVAFLEDKELYVFDEWAADQDPVFKNVFYTRILPELRAKGKAIVVISHDDRYFHIADNLLVMEQGKFTAQKRASRAVSIKTPLIKENF